ncbi:molybdopterin dinucleotide binding domain-containing protein [Adlercreutzia equolifaciens]|uniref:molybdopterin dinucleotide binding domain-containing protein n=1 Tax=Adlercreutzia equolifaciens TaxID=446660 RepID=UPI0026DD581E|nr:molybdopterin dinucleotide binding domain-containing protein [Adlercreutzia equolifaciens]
MVDSVMTDTACYSDLVLPVAQWFEFEDITGGGQTNFYTGFNEKAIEPLHESKTDSDIARLIAEKMGLGEYFTETDAEILDDAMLSSETCQKLGLSYASLKESKLVPQRTGVKIAFEGAKFTTPSGRMEFYVEKPVAFSNYGQDIDVERERLPRFFPPGEAWPENEKYEKYPLTLMTSRTKYQVHGQWFSVRNLRELDPDPTFRINPADARARGVEDGAWAEVFNDRGHCVAKCIYSEAVRPGSVVYMKNWAAKYFKAGSWAEVLSLEFDPVTVNHCFMDALVDVRPWSQED